jgi:hypothetical protein
MKVLAFLVLLRVICQSWALKLLLNPINDTMTVNEQYLQIRTEFAPDNKTSANIFSFHKRIPELHVGSMMVSMGCNFQFFNHFHPSSS